ncbi:MAG: sigma-54-dependent Fis family transcriptional regulator [Candidatus Aminicenantes bacterium]|nr:sigma-54-dependent Fis family transcriptional regulator [Candidatus Aminicenantes bacterium]
MTDPEKNILIIDDEEAIQDSCKQLLTREGYGVFIAGDAQEGLDIFLDKSIHTILLDLKLPEKNGMELLPILKRKKPEVPVIIITGFATIESAVEAIKLGAFDYLSKPFTPAELRVIVNKALKSRELYTQAMHFQKRKDDSGFDMVIGKSKVMEKVVDIVRRVSTSESTVLITGESGTGKELLAREIHKHSLRKNAPFVVVDCGALVETLFESELFGHVKGSFTGAHVTKHGRFEVANGGTIFLDEISNISLNIQAKLLRAIQEKEITRIGSTQPTKVDVRIIAATNENLAECVKAGKFREDLFYRLSVVPVHLPPLRERKEDIPILIDHFLKKNNIGKTKDIKKISQQVKNALIEYNWPGNIRELENTIERAVVLSRRNEIEIEDLIYHGIGSPLSFMQSQDGKFKSMEEMEKEYISMVLQSQQGNKSRTAKVLGIDRKTLLSKIKKYHLE